MKKYQLRVVDEKKELDGRIDRLETFLASPNISEGITTKERNRMRRQLVFMKDYSAVLAERIAAFPAEG